MFIFFLELISVGIIVGVFSWLINRWIKIREIKRKTRLLNMALKSEEGRHMITEALLIPLSRDKTRYWKKNWYDLVEKRKGK